MGNKKPGALSSTGLLVVAGTGEISNIEFLKDLSEVVDYLNIPQEYPS